MRLIIGLMLIFSVVYGKVYDCFLFFNEYEILELRLEELYNYVDKFVIVESSEGFRGHPKPFNFEEHKDRYARFLDKIIYIKLEEHTETDDTWVRQSYQRNQIMQGLVNCEPKDLIIISDVDEYIPGAIIKKLYWATKDHPMIGFMQRMYRWFLNRSTNEWWAGTAALRYSTLVLSSPQEVRDLVRQGKMPYWWMGWHFTSMGGYRSIVQKYINFSAGCDEEMPYEHWRSHCTNHQTLVKIDKTYPKFVQNNRRLLKDRGLLDLK